ncbi:MAG: CDP-alcohol phosphatidyltransferase family protein [Clostridia bacterium]|nr:CDP-alcohol phosphatidyltransferase family protein [Clostridia bacterium]
MFKNGKKNCPLIGYYNYSVIVTYIGLLIGIYGMNLALTGRIRSAIICLLFCGLCDMMDGAIARTCKRTEDAMCFGMQIDSLCDMVCFGVFPAVIAFVLGPANWFSIAAAMLYTLAAVIRLSYFNVQEIMKEPDAEKRTHYTGLPVTTSALVMPLIALVCALPKATAYVYPAALAIMGVLFVSRFKVKKPYGRAIALMALIGLIVLILIITLGGAIPCTRIFTSIN